MNTSPVYKKISMFKTVKNVSMFTKFAIEIDWNSSVINTLGCSEVLFDVIIWRRLKMTFFGMFSFYTITFFIIKLH